MNGCEILLLINKLHDANPDNEVAVICVGDDIGEYRSHRRTMIDTARFGFMGYSPVETLCSFRGEAEKLAKSIEISQRDFDFMLKEPITVSDNTPWYAQSKKGGFKNKRNWRR